MSESITLNAWQKRAHKFAWVTVALTLLMIAVGATVTTTKAGDANPGWSFEFWQWFTTWMESTGKRAWEDGHRVLGTIIGFSAICSAICLWKGERGNPRRWLGLIVVAMLLLQGVAGGIRVLVVWDPDFQAFILNLTGGGSAVESHRAVIAMF
ncbi:MAG: hypothetical protein ACYTDT_07035, partial [Planctomycetota bacterium]